MFVPGEIDDEKMNEEHEEDTTEEEEEPCVKQPKINGTVSSFSL